jgi:hypothetical protein
MKKSIVVAVCLCMLVFCTLLGTRTPDANAQVLLSSVGNTTLNYSQGESISITGVPPSVSFSSCSGGVCTDSESITTIWQLASTRTQVQVNLFFNNCATAMSDGKGDNISCGNIYAQMDGTGGFSPCNTAPNALFSGTIPASGACNVGVGVTVSSANNNYAGQSTHQFVFQIPSSVLQTLPANSYTGTVSWIAGAE